jgi:hypothetical protein
MSFALELPGTASLMVYPAPGVNTAGLEVVIKPSNRSPPKTLPGVPLLAALLTPCEVAVASSEFAKATPEYSRMANRSVLLEMLSLTVTELAPPAMFSA